VSSRELDDDGITPHQKQQQQQQHKTAPRSPKKAEAKQAALTTRAGADPGPLNECILGILGIYIYDIFLDWCFL
jgi:hypothetical protein